MRRNVMSLALATVVGLLLSAGSAQACHKRKCNKGCAPQPCGQVVVCEPCAPPPCPPEPCHKPKKCKGLFGGGLCHKKSHCEPAPCTVATVEYVTYAAPQHHASGQAVAAPQGGAPTKQMPPVPGK